MSDVRNSHFCFLRVFFSGQRLKLDFCHSVYKFFHNNNTTELGHDWGCANRAFYTSVTFRVYYRVRDWYWKQLRTRTAGSLFDFVVQQRFEISQSNAKIFKNNPCQTDQLLSVMPSNVLFSWVLLSDPYILQQDANKVSLRVSHASLLKRLRKTMECTSNVWQKLQSPTVSENEISKPKIQQE